MWAVQYSVQSLSNSMAACKLNPLPTTPFSGQGMIGRSVGCAVEAFYKASFLAEEVTEVRTEVYEVFLFTYLAVFSTWQHIACVIFHLFAITWKNKFTIQKTPTIFLQRISVFICSSSTSDMLPPDRKNIYLYQQTSWCFALCSFLLGPLIWRQLSWLKDQSW